MDNPMYVIVNLALKKLSIEEIAACNLAIMLNGYDWDEIPDHILGAKKLDPLKTDNGKMHQETKRVLQELVNARVNAEVNARVNAETNY
jgi:hypothetical protein